MFYLRRTQAILFTSDEFVASFSFIPTQANKCTVTASEVTIR